MSVELLHRFEHEGKRYVIDPETCFCFECDAISWAVLNHYPLTSANRIYHVLAGTYAVEELREVVGELEWLRATKSILPTPKREDFQKIFHLERGLKRVTLLLGDEPVPAAARAQRRWRRDRTEAAAEDECDIGRDAIALLMGRSGAQTDLEFEIIESGSVHDVQRLAGWCGQAFAAAKLAGKRIKVAVRVADVALARPPEALQGHAVSVRLELAGDADVERSIRGLVKVRPDSLVGWAKSLESGGDSVTARVIVRPNHPRFEGAVEAVEKAGFSVIELDLDGALAAHPELSAGAMLDGMRASARYYAERLRGHHYFRLDPVASLFWRIHQGSAQPRSDAAGTYELAVDRNGTVYPSPRFVGVAAFQAGSVRAGAIDEELLGQFDDVGSLTTPACMRCWARNLCGGGTAAVHHARSGSCRTPHAPWCEAQRAWLEAAVAAFSLLSSAGVNFTRVYGALRRAQRPSLFTMAKAAFRMQIGIRPVEEADAAMLTEWEDWNEAAYFAFNETGLLMATRYDREMDALHPRGIDQELMLLRRNGEPLGLVKVRPDRASRSAWAWIYMHDPSDYASDAVRKSFRFVLHEAGDQQALDRLLIYAGAEEQPLCAFLEAIGAEHVGTLRQALYLHGTYRDVRVYDFAEQVV
ncbi:MAG TPA: SPASM domain-containing protein [Candidatus Hydrogenedentes bacterium]|nr:SPASM domain-containing protein [Candidatus Hydrogenedentota bacterium]HPG66229.1 SPASM domain-containing protein [Candidatus Hydrogenedentota bacterium]